MLPTKTATIGYLIVTYQNSYYGIFNCVANNAIIANMYIKVKIQAGARKEMVQKVSDGRDDHYKISVKEKAENNNANRRLIEIMHDEYPNSIIGIISGHHSPSKILSIDPKQ